MKICPECNETHLGDDKFCHKDGTQLKPLYEHTCGAKILPFYKYCPNCGNPIDRTGYGRVSSVQGPHA